MTTHSSILAWRTPWTEEPSGLQLWDCKELTQLSNLVHTYHCFKGQWKGEKMPKQRVICFLINKNLYFIERILLFLL